jgi:hypothetical protein
LASVIQYLETSQKTEFFSLIAVKTWNLTEILFHSPLWWLRRDFEATKSWSQLCQINDVWMFTVTPPSLLIVLCLGKVMSLPDHWYWWVDTKTRETDDLAKFDLLLLILSQWPRGITGVGSWVLEQGRAGGMPVEARMYVSVFVSSIVLCVRVRGSDRSISRPSISSRYRMVHRFKTDAELHHAMWPTPRWLTGIWRELAVH